MTAPNIEQAILTFSTIYIFWFIQVGSKWGLLFPRWNKELSPIYFSWLYDHVAFPKTENCLQK